MIACHRSCVRGRVRPRGHAARGVRRGRGVYGSYQNLDGLFRDQAAELDRGKREVLLHGMQQIVHERAMSRRFGERAFLNGVVPRVEESGLALIAGYAYSGPYEDLNIQAR